MDSKANDVLDALKGLLFFGVAGWAVWTFLPSGDADSGPDLLETSSTADRVLDSAKIKDIQLPKPTSEVVYDSTPNIELMRRIVPHIETITGLTRYGGAEAEVCSGFSVNGCHAQIGHFSLVAINDGLMLASDSRHTTEQHVEICSAIVSALTGFEPSIVTPSVMEAYKTTVSEGAPVAGIIAGVKISLSAGNPKWPSCDFNDVL